VFGQTTNQLRRSCHCTADMDVVAYHAMNYSSAIAKALGDLAGVPPHHVSELGVRPIIVSDHQRRRSAARRLSQVATGKVHTLAGVAGRWWVATGQPSTLASRLAQPRLLQDALMRHGVVEMVVVTGSKTYGADQAVTCEWLGPEGAVARSHHGMLTAPHCGMHPLSLFLSLPV